MKTHIVYRQGRDGTRNTSLFVTEAEAVAMVLRYRDNGITAEAFPAHHRPSLATWTTRPPYGMTADKPARCINAEPGTYGHECGKPARWIGTDANGFRACYCDDCKSHGAEARRVKAWAPIAPSVPFVDLCQETAYGTTQRLSFQIRVF